MRKQILILAVLASGLELATLAAVGNVRVLGVTHTQAILGYTAPSSSACTVEVSKSSSYSPLVHDVDSTLFTGAGSDGGGARSRVFNTGKMTVETALDGNNYSRALQTATLHYYRITCGTDTAAGTFETRNIPLGMTYVPNQQVNGTTGTWLQPTSSHVDRTQEIVDPITGVLLKRTQLPRDRGYVNGPANVVNGTGSAWTNPNNVTASDNVNASYSGTAQDKLAANVPTGIDNTYVSLDFVQVTMKGHGDGGTSAARTIQICLSIDGVTCVGSTNDIILPTSDGIVFYNQPAIVGDLMGWKTASIDAITMIKAGSVRLLVWKKATTGSDTIFLDNLQMTWGTSEVNLPTSGGFHDICGRVDSGGWVKCVLGTHIYAIQTSTGLVRNMGILAFYNITVPGFGFGGNGCETFGFASRLWDATDPNTIYCNGAFVDDPNTGVVNGRTIVKFTLDSTNTDTGPDSLVTMTNPVLVVPRTNSLESLLAQFDPTLPAGYNCGFDSVQGNYLIGGCRVGNQDTYGYVFVFSLGNGAQVGSPGCGTIIAGRCSTSGAGIVAVNKFFANPMSRWCTLHTVHSNGNVAVASIEGQTTPGNLPVGNSPSRVTLINAIDATQTNITVTSSWPTAEPQAGTVSSVGATLTVTGGAFSVRATYGDTICAGGQCHVITNFLADNVAVMDAPFSPDVSGQTWTVTWPAAPAAYQPGLPISTKLPHFLMPPAVGDYFKIDTELVQIAAMNSPTSWTINRGCWLAQQPCAGTGVAHSSSVSVPTSCNTLANDSYGYKAYWHFLLDPTASDSNIGDPTNSGNHAYINVAAPNGFSGGHMTSRGKFLIMADYQVMAVANGLLNLKGVARRPNYPINESFCFGGHCATNGGNTFQRHPSNQQSDLNSGYQYDYFTDVTPLVGGGGFIDPSGPPSTLIEGTLYKAGLATYTQSELTPTRKFLPTLAVCGVNPLLDISGPSSHIATSTTDYTYCYAERNGECRNSGDIGGASTAGQHFLNCPKINTFFCTGGENYVGYNDTCIGNQSFDGNATVQFGLVVPPNEDTVLNEGPKRARTLAKVFDQPRRLSGFSNAKILPDNSWILHPGVSNIGYETFLLKNPGMPPLDSLNRQTFIPVRLTLNPPAGLSVDNAYVEFGYDQALLCTARAEICVAAASNNPYFFAGESFSGVSCASGCTMDVPSIPSRVLYYRFVYRDASNTVLRRSGIVTVAVP